MNLARRKVVQDYFAAQSSDIERARSEGQGRNGFGLVRSAVARRPSRRIGQECREAVFDLERDDELELPACPSRRVSKSITGETRHGRERERRKLTCFAARICDTPPQRDSSAHVPRRHKRNDFALHTQSTDQQWVVAHISAGRTYEAPRDGGNGLRSGTRLADSERPPVDIPETKYVAAAGRDIACRIALYGPGEMSACGCDEGKRDESLMLTIATAETASSLSKCRSACVALYSSVSAYPH